MMHSDRLSELPDSLLIQIISLLEMKESVQSGILSKRWKHLWTETPNAIYEFTVRDGLEKNMSYFDIVNWKQENLPQILSFIDRTLLQCVSSMKKFSLKGFEDISSTDSPVIDFVNRWIAFVSTKNLESLHMDLDLYPIPDCLYSDFSSLKMLELYNVAIHVLPLVKWPVLESLELGSMALLDVTIARILSGCPRLKTIILNEILGMSHLNVMSPSVQRLALFNMKFKVLEIRAPWLQELEIGGHFCGLECRLVDLSSLSRACLTFLTRPRVENSLLSRDKFIYEHYESWSAMAIELISAPPCHVGELFIGSQLIQVLSTLKLLGKPSLPFKCKKVKIYSPIWKYDLPGIQYLLESAHDLETLLIKVDERKLRSAFPLPKISTLFGNQEPHLSLPEARFAHLKNIKVDYSINPLNEPMPTDTSIVHGVCLDLELLTYILSGAVALERLVIVISVIPSCSCFNEECLSSSCVYQYIQRLSSKLLATSLAGTESAEWKLSKTNTRFEFNRSNCASTS